MVASTRALLGREAHLPLDELLKSTPAYIMSLPANDNPLKELARELALFKGFYSGSRVQETIAEIANDMKISYKQAQKLLNWQSAAKYFKTHNIALETTKDIDKHGGSIDLGGSYLHGHRSIYIPPRKRRIHKYFHK